MTPITGTSGLLSPVLTPLEQPAGDPRRIEGAAQQFEALLIGQMLKSTHESDDGGWTGSDNDDAGSQAVELAEEQLAQAMASHGGLGLARVIARGLTHAKDREVGDATPAAQKLQP
jgi:Rod binding domain-containing protein